MTAKEYLKQAYLLDKQIQVEVKELEQLREMRGTIQGCSYGEKIGTNPNRNLEAPFIKTIEKIWEYEKKIDGKINRLVDLRSEINTAIEKMENSEERLLLKYRYLKNESWEDISYMYSFFLHQCSSFLICFIIAITFFENGATKKITF